MLNQSVSSLMEQMFIVSDCLRRLGYKKLAKLAQQSNHWEFTHDFVMLISREATRREDYDILDRLAYAGLRYS
jgi:hypothetical protein